MVIAVSRREKEWTNISSGCRWETAQPTRVEENAVGFLSGGVRLRMARVVTRRPAAVFRETKFQARRMRSSN